MDSQRIDGIKYNLDALSDAELIGIRGNLLRTHARIIGEVSLLEFKLFQRTHSPLPFDEIPTEAMGERIEWANYVEATRDC